MFAVPNVMAHPLTVSVPIITLLYNQLIKHIIYQIKKEKHIAK